MLIIDTLHITFQLQPRNVDAALKDLHDLCSITPQPGLRPFASNVFSVPVYLEQCKALHGYVYGYAIILKDFIAESQTFKTVRLGSIFYGGNANRPFLQLNGAGCKLVDMSKLSLVVEQMYKVRITRVDLAFDDVEGHYGSILDVVQLYKDGLFKRGGHQPSVSQVGDWISDDAPKGRTVYVGSRKGAAMMRIYEKGRELGIPSSPWIRYELELKSVDVDIPVTILTNPEPFFLGINLHNQRFSDSCKRSKLKVKAHKVDELEGDALWAHRCKYARLQAGAVLLEQVIKSDGDIGSLLPFAKSSKIKVDRLDNVVPMCDNEHIKE